MGVKLEFYKSQIRSLLPRGKVFSFVPGNLLDKLIEGVAYELERIDDRADVLLSESDPRGTSELIDEWEEMLGLPGECGSLATTLQDRRNQIISKLTQTGNMSKAFYVKLAQRLGYSVSISDVYLNEPFRVGVGRMGAHLNSNPDWIYSFTVHAPSFTVRYFRAGANSMGDRLVDFGDDLLECLITESKPAHMIVVFKYG